jgi:hypothetical protein
VLLFLKRMYSFNMVSETFLLASSRKAQRNIWLHHDVKVT